MRLVAFRVVLVCLALALGLVALPAAGQARFEPGARAAATVRTPAPRCLIVRERIHGRIVKRRVCGCRTVRRRVNGRLVTRIVCCRTVRRRVHGRIVKRRVCVTRRPAPKPVPPPTGTGTGTGTSTGTGTGTSTGTTTGTTTGTGTDTTGGYGTGTGTGYGTGTGTGTYPGDPGGDPLYEVVDLITNNDFEDTTDPTACFDGNGAATVSSTTTNPIAGANSLQADLPEWNKAGCFNDYPFHEGPIARSVTAEADLRVDSPTSGTGRLQVCAIVYFEDIAEPQNACQDVAPATGVIHVSVANDTQGKRVQRAFFELATTGTAFQATLDNAHLWVDQLRGSTGPRDGGGGGGGTGGGGTGGGGGAGCDLSTAPAPNGPPDPTSPCDVNETPSATSVYTPQPLTLPAARPFISLRDYLQVPTSSTIFTKFKSWVDQTVFDHNPGYAYSSRDAVIMFARTGNTAYIDDAIARVDADVRDAEADIAAGGQPSVASDSYFDSGPLIEELALTYDYGFSRLTQSQKDRWKAYGDQTISNIWSPLTATWGGRPAGTFAWSAWAVNDPGDNYFYRFMQATQLWALATRNQAWFDFLQQWKFPLLSDTVAELPGGGSREGTGYGTSHQRLWENARMWKASTGETLTAVAKHARESIDYWVHATVPTLQFFAPIGDQARVSMPELFDYQENLIREAVMAAPGTPEAGRGMWWIAHNSVPDLLTQGFTLSTALMQPADPQQAPTALSYSAPGVGQLFARSSWNSDATWLQLTAGPYDQSHAHMDQGGFTLYRNTWMSVTSNVWSNNGLEGSGSNGYLGTPASNVIRFTRSDGSAIAQNFSTSSLTSQTLAGNELQAHADLTNAYSRNSTLVQHWTRDLDFVGNTLRVQDSCQVASGVGAVFQLHVPVQPVDHGGGSLDAGKLHIATGSTMQVRLVDMRTVDAAFQSGWRIDITNPNGCAFDVTLTAAP